MFKQQFINRIYSNSFLPIIIILCFYITIIFYNVNPLQAQVSDNITIEKSVDKEHVQRDDPSEDARDVTYTLTITTNGYCNTPLDIAIAFDRSGSMYGAHIDTAKEATVSFINEMDEETDLISLVSYGSNASLDEPLSNNFANIINTVNGLIANGSTNIGDSLLLSREELVTNGRADIEKVILVFTDGIWNAGPDPEPIAEDIKNIDGIRIISVGIGDLVDQAFLEAIASSSEDCYLVEDIDDLEETFINIARDLQYEDTEIIVTDNISQILEYAEFISATDNGYFDGNTITWNLGVDPCNDSVSVHFTVRVKADTPDLSELINSATASDTGSGLEAVSEEVKTIVHAPDLEISKSSGWSQVTPGTEINYAVNVKNNGTGNAYNVTITDNLPTNYFIIYEDSISDNGKFINNSIIWDNNGTGYIIDGSFSPTNSGQSLGTEHTFSYKGRIDDNCPTGEGITNTVTLTAVNNGGYSLQASNTIQIGSVLAATGDSSFLAAFSLGVISLGSILILTVIERRK